MNECKTIRAYTVANVHLKWLQLNRHMYMFLKCFKNVSFYSYRCCWLCILFNFNINYYNVLQTYKSVFIPCSSLCSCSCRAKHVSDIKGLLQPPFDLTLLLKHSLYRVAAMLTRHRYGIVHFPFSTDVIEAYIFYICIYIYNTLERPSHSHLAAAESASRSSSTLDFFLVWEMAYLQGDISRW